MTIWNHVVGSLTYPYITPPTMGGKGAVYFHGKKISDLGTREKLLALANLLGRDIHITSGDRTKQDQLRLTMQGLKPARHSQHLVGRAADIQVEGMTPKEAAPFARQVGFNGIGIYSHHLHVDTRQTAVTWIGK